MENKLLNDLLIFTSIIIKPIAFFLSLWLSFKFINWLNKKEVEEI